MKKTIKSSALLLVIAMILFTLTGCMGNKLVATKSNEDSMFGKYEEKVEISFKNDKADKITITTEYEEEEKAESAASLYKLAINSSEDELKGLEVEQKGKKVVLKMDSKAFSSQEGMKDEDLTKDNLKKALEEDGYKVK